MADNIHTTALDEGGFLTKPAVAAMAASPSWRHMMLLIRHGCGRISVAAEDVQYHVGKIEASEDYVRDVCLIAGTLDKGPRRTELRDLLGAIQ